MATPIIKKPEKSDFNPGELLANHEQHERNISDLTKRVAKIEGRLDTPQALAAFFQESAKDSRVLEGVFAQMFCRFLKEHPEVQEAVKQKMNEVDRNFFWKNFKRLWLPLYSGCLVVATLVAKEVVHWIVAFIPHK